MKMPSRELSDEMRRLAKEAAADLGVPLRQVSLLLLLHWLDLKNKPHREEAA